MENYFECNDYLGLCHHTSKNETNHEYYMAPTTKSKYNVVPRKYFCRWDQELLEDYDWALEILRYQSKIVSERIDVIT